MIDDFKPVRRTVNPSLRNSLDNLSTAQNKKPAEQTPAPAFHTPEETAAADTSATFAPPPAPRLRKPDQEESRLRRFLRLFVLHWPPHKKEYIAAASVVVLVSLGGFLAVTLHHPKPAVVAAKPKPVVKAAPKPTTVPSTLTGLPVDPGINQRPVTGVMIENSQAARPQAGLGNGQAGVVFEAIAEGGITRFLALFQDTTPENVGPIRSARPYYEQWALGFDAGYAHVGGSPEALADIKAWGVRDLDQFYNSGSYHRVSSRAAPHNVYTGIPTLLQLEASKGYNSSNFVGFARKDKEAPSTQPTAKSINIAISGPIYNVHYDYNPATNSYNRSEGGAPHIDANTNTQISPKVVITLAMPYTLEADHYHSSYNTIGSGQATVFQDGTVTVGTWTKPSANAQFTFTDATGNPIKLNPGQTWLTTIGSPANVTYTP
jgi:hypothetical protein